MSTAKVAALATGLGLGSGAAALNAAGWYLSPAWVERERWKWTPPASPLPRRREESKGVAPLVRDWVDSLRGDLGIAKMCKASIKRHDLVLPYSYYYLSHYHPDQIVGFEVEIDGERLTCPTPLIRLSPDRLKCIETVEELKAAFEEEQPPRDNSRDWTVTFRTGTEDTEDIEFVLAHETAETLYKHLMPNSEVATGQGWHTGEGELTIVPLGTGYIQFSGKTEVWKVWNDGDRPLEHKISSIVSKVVKNKPQLVRARDLTRD